MVLDVSNVLSTACSWLVVGGVASFSLRCRDHSSTHAIGQWPSIRGLVNANPWGQNVQHGEKPPPWPVRGEQRANPPASPACPVRGAACRVNILLGSHPRDPCLQPDPHRPP